MDSGERRCDIPEEIKENVFNEIVTGVSDGLINEAWNDMPESWKLCSKHAYAISPEEDAIKNLCRPRENIISFGASSVVMCLDPQQELESQFNNRMKRGFVKRESRYLAQMERSIKQQFQEAAILFQRREFETKHKDYKVSLPFCFGGDIGIRAVKPLDFGKQIKDVVAECLKWRYCAEQLQEVTSGIRLLCPTRFPDKDSSTYQAMQDILGGNDALNLYPYVDGDEESKNKLIMFARSA